MERIIDDTDRKILTILQENARIANSEIAERIGMAPSATFERLRKLERRGVIKGYEVRLDPAKLDCSLVAFIMVRTNELAGEQMAGPELVKIPEVLEVYNVAGEDCYLLKVRTGSPTELSRLIRERIGRIPAVHSTRTTIVMETYKETIALPLTKSTSSDHAKGD